MKIKLISIFVILILISTFFAYGKSVEKSSSFIISDETDLPIWNIGNFWVYDMHFDFLLSGVVELDGLDQNDPNKGITDMKVEVIEVDENNDEYTLDISGNLKAELKLFGIGLGEYTADLEGTAHMEISTLAIKDFEFFASGQYHLLTSRDTDVLISMDFNPSFDFFDFPINSQEGSWNADTYATLSGHITVEGLYDEDFSTEGPFEDEMISFVKTEEITVPAGSFNCFQISGSMGPSHNGWSRMWYSPEARYFAKLDEKIVDWEGVDAELDLELQATNCHTSALMDITIHRIKKLDTIEIIPELPGAEWSYKLSVDDGEKWIYETNNEYSDGQDDHTQDVYYQYNLYTITPRIIIKVWDRDFWSGDDLADISSTPGAEINDNTPDDQRCLLKFKYDISKNCFVDNDTIKIDGGYFVSSGDYLPDGSSGDPPDENDAKLWFKISDDYDPPQKPGKAQGPSSGGPGKEYTYKTSAAGPEENQRFYKWDWGDNTYSNWLGPFNADEEIDASHAWAKKGSYNIRVKSKDVYNVESKWSDPLSVNIPRSKYYLNPFFSSLLGRLFQIMKIINK